MTYVRQEFNNANPSRCNRCRGRPDWTSSNGRRCGPWSAACETLVQCPGLISTSIKISTLRNRHGERPKPQLRRPYPRQCAWMTPVGGIPNPMTRRLAPITGAAIRRWRPTVRREGSPIASPAGGQPPAAKARPSMHANSFPSIQPKRRAENHPSPITPHRPRRSRRQPARARQVSNPLRSNSNRRIAERIRRTVFSPMPISMAPRVPMTPVVLNPCRRSRSARLPASPGCGR